MALTLTVAGNRILSSDINQFYNLLKGVAASGESVTLIYNNQALIFQPSSDPSAGTRVVVIKNNSGTTLASWRYDGLLELLSAAAAPASAVAGSIYFDSLLSYLRVYDGTNWRELQTVYPNLVLNSDFGRRTVFGLAMPEVFADTSGYTRIDAGTAPSVSSNILTFGAASNKLGWPLVGYNANFWRDGRISGTFKAVSTTGLYLMDFHYVDVNNRVTVDMSNGNFELRKIIGGSNTVVATVIQAVTLNRWYWIELEAQGTTYTAKLYDTGGTASGVTKASSTLLQTLTGTISDSAVVAGGVTISSDQATAQWGGIATGNGGVYVETWLPESFDYTFAPSGVLGGQAIGFDESADSGPLAKQWALRAYIPATNRRIQVKRPTQDGSVIASSAYTASVYLKVSGLGGSGNLVQLDMYEAASDQTLGTVHSMTDGGSTSWTRKTSSFTTASTARRAYVIFELNAASTATGTAYFMLPQLEQGSAATAWRNAPADDAPIVWSKQTGLTATTTSATFAEIDSRDAAGNFFLPWDAQVRCEVVSRWRNTGLNALRADATLDGTAMNSGEPTIGATEANMAVANVYQPLQFAVVASAAAGKHRIAARWLTSAGTLDIGNRNFALMITATRGK